MTAKEFVLRYYPNAYPLPLHHIVRNVGSKTTYEIYKDCTNPCGILSTGKTESNAWVNAKKNILNGFINTKQK